jgi:pimeloyl-ACP methyl ester carboxylesterase
MSFEPTRTLAMQNFTLFVVLVVALLLSEVCSAFEVAAPFRPRKKIFALAFGSRTNHHENVRSTVYEDQVELPNGVSMQVLSSFPANPNADKPVLLFLHGSFHAAWCWSEKFFAYFVDAGYTVVAPSWRGTGGTPAGEGIKKVQIMQHVSDLEGLLEALPSIIQRHGGKPPTNTKPVVICHSFGGLAVMKLFEADPLKRPFSGVVTICSVPPSGNGKMTMRFLRRSLVASWKITAGFAMKKCLTDASLCRQLFFGGETFVKDDGTIEDYGVSDADVQRYQSYFARDSAATIDLLDLAKKLPSATTNADGRAAFVDDSFPPCLVMGASDDYLVDREGLEETARYFGLDEPIIVDSPHDVMLGSKWENAASALKHWLQETVVVAKN